jgi:hypothetical protein
MILSTITIFFMMSIIMAVQSQTWIGTYTTDSTCSRTACCCLDGQIVVIHPSTSILAVTSGLIGICYGVTTYSGTTSYPSVYTSYFTVSGTQPLTLTLSSDSKTIAGVNPLNSACNGNAVKSGAIKQMTNTTTMVALVFVGVTISASNE